MDSESKLWNIFQNTNDWMRYAEQKNVHMLTFVTIQIGILGFLSKEPDKWLHSNLVIGGLIILSLSFLISAISLLPFSKWGDFKYKKLFFPLYSFYNFPIAPKNKDDRILVHEDAVKYNFSEYRAKL
jgi:hypothetical protein